MSYLLNDEQREIRDLVRQLARDRIAPRAAEIDESHEFPWDIVELYREHGLFGLFFDEAYGGLGTGVLLALTVIEEVSKVCATSGVILAVQELGSLGLKLAGNDEQKQRYLPRLASGELLAAYALTEAGSGSDSAAMRSTARRDGDEYVLNGSKRFITNAGVASLYTVFAKTDPDAGHSGISAFVVEADTPGFEVTRLEPKLGITGSTTGELAFEDVRVPAENLPRCGGRRLQARDADPRPLASGNRSARSRDRAGRDRLRARVRQEPRDDGQADRRAPADRRQARRHGDRMRGRARAALQVRRDGRPGRRRRRADEGVRTGEALLHRHRDVGDDRGRADPRRLRLHQGVSGRAHDARREDHADLRRHERDPAPGDRARDAEGEPRVSAHGSRSTLQLGPPRHPRFPNPLTLPPTTSHLPHPATRLSPLPTLTHTDRAIPHMLRREEIPLHRDRPHLHFTPPSQIPAPCPSYPHTPSSQTSPTSPHTLQTRPSPPSPPTHHKPSPIPHLLPLTLPYPPPHTLPLSSHLPYIPTSFTPTPSSSP